MEALVGGSLIVTLFGIVLLIAWIILPFALIGTKPLLRELIREVQKTNALLAQQSASARPASPEQPSALHEMSESAGRSLGQAVGRIVK